ncbi:hypothetical protein JTX50_001339 [Escherichia coli]|nr:hypothetical protein [Escherichia coli]EHC2660391.1 hypothetical protein [Escherichia coli]
MPALSCVNSSAVFPAPAGINRDVTHDGSAQIGVPRASGDKPWETIAIPRYNECSPRQRG